MRAFFILPLFLLPSCSWRYEALHEKVRPNSEKIVFAMTGYSVLYGSGEWHGERWEIIYPSSAWNAATETINAKDFTTVQVNSKGVKNTVSGFISVRGQAEVEARLVQTKEGPDGSRVSVQAPINGIHRLQRQER